MTCALIAGIHKMDVGDDIEDPFKLRDLWQSSNFTLGSLPPLEPVHLDLANLGSFTFAFFFNYG
jgi:hypothetical protein